MPPSSHDVTIKLSVTDALALHEVLTELINTRQERLHSRVSIALHQDEFETVKVAQRVLENAINLLQEEV